MVKFSILFSLPLLLILHKSHPQHIPEPPIQILTRQQSLQTLSQDFISSFCSNCGQQSSQCLQNLNVVQNIGQLGFSIKNITQNQYNVSSVLINIQNVTGSYSFSGYQLNDTVMRYILYMPYDKNKSKNKKINGVVIYHHSTIFGLSQVPTAQTSQISAIAALYVSSGYAVVFPNYLGYQFGDNFPHPYIIYPQVNVKSSILALNNAIDSLKSMFPSVESLDLYSVGYSEGALYALWLEKCLKSPISCQGAKLNDIYNYRGAAGLQGPYDLNLTFKQFLTQKVKKQPDNDNTFKIQNQTITNFNKPSLLAMTLTSFMYFTEGKINPRDDRINNSFWSMKCGKQLTQKCKINGTQYDIIYDVIKANKNSMDIQDSIAYSDFGKSMGKDKYLGVSKQQYMSGYENSIYGLASQKLINDKIFIETLTNASIINYEPTIKTFLFSLKEDSVNTIRIKFQHTILIIQSILYVQLIRAGINMSITIMGKFQQICLLCLISEVCRKFDDQLHPLFFNINLS